MINEIDSYIKIYPSMISKDRCKKIVNALKYSSWKKHTFYCPDGSHVSPSGDNEIEISWDKIFGYDELNKDVWMSYKGYIDQYGSAWFNGWSAFNRIRFNHYSVGQQMAMHCDHISDIFDGERKGVPILTSLGVLNDDYEGGEFIMRDKKINLGTGDIIVFPSNFLFPHKVDPVTKGERYSFVSWAW